MSGHGRISAVAAVGSAALVALTLACGCDGTTNPTVCSRVSGRVQLIGYERDAQGAQTGTRTVNPTGVPLYLLSGRAVADSTMSSGGQYVFDDVPEGPYTVFCEVIPGVSDTTGRFVVGDSDVTIGDTLKLRAPGAGLSARPNPFSGQTSLMYSVDVADSVLLRLVDVSLAPVKDLVDGPTEAGLHVVAWDGTDDDGAPVASGSYWAILWQSTREDVDLVFVSD